MLTGLYRSGLDVDTFKSTDWQYRLIIFFLWSYFRAAETKSESADYIVLIAGVGERAASIMRSIDIAITEPHTTPIIMYTAVLHWPQVTQIQLQAFDFTAITARIHIG